MRKHRQSTHKKCFVFCLITTEEIVKLGEKKLVFDDVSISIKDAIRDIERICAGCEFEGGRNLAN